MTRPEVWLDPGLGVSGDMFLGVLVGLGADIETIKQGLETLDIDGWTIAQTETVRGSLTATRVEVQTEDAAHHRAWSTIDALLTNSGLTEFVKDGSRRTFRLLGEVEANQHGTTIDEVHFHEVGAIDAIVDIVGAWLALENLNVDRVHSGPVGLGHGTVAAAHGLLPLPAPATTALLHGIPVKGLEFEGETTTPTGAALIATMASVFGPMPQGTVVSTARGAGGRNPETHPNVTSGLLIETTNPVDSAHQAVELATNIDDVTPEVLGYVLAKLIDAGADDAWIVPIQMKKNRSAHQLRVLTTPALSAQMRHIISAETGTLGIREFPVAKFVLARQITTIEVRGCEIRLKVGPHGAKAEHDDLVLAATKTGLPLRQLATEAMQLAATAELGHNLGHESSSS